MKKIVRRVINPTFPIILMTVFSIFLFVALVIRVYQADRDHAKSRVSGMQSILAAEAGIHYVKVQLQKYLGKGDAWENLKTIGLDENEKDLFPNAWRKIGVFSDSYFRIISVKKLSILNKSDTPLFDESGLLEVVSEGRSGGHFSQSTGILSIADLVKTFAVMNSLNEYYYGQPIQMWASMSGGLDPFVKENRELFESGKLNLKGVCFDPGLIGRMFRPGGPNPFATSEKFTIKGNYGSLSYRRDGDSPCIGPLYCSTPIIVDSHTFFGPIQTALYFYRRGEGKSRLQMENVSVALPSSRRIQLALDHLEGEVPEGSFADIDSRTKSSFVSPWRPNFAQLRQLAKETGIYIDKDGVGWNRGEKDPVDYHKNSHHVLSESYLSFFSDKYQKDNISEGFIVLSSKVKFAGKNNIDALNLKGSKILFSENSVFIRGQIGGDLVVVTPKHIYLTGSTNDEGNFHLFLVGGEGVGISTIDLEAFIKSENLGPAYVDAAQNWTIRATIYKPGAGWFCDWPAGSESDSRVGPSEMAKGQKVSLTIIGSCLEGNLERWLDYAGKSGIKVKWDRFAADRLPIVPKTVNVLRLRSLPQNN